MFETCSVPACSQWEVSLNGATCLHCAEGPLASFKPTSPEDIRLISSGKFLESPQTLIGTETNNLLAANVAAFDWSCVRPLHLD